MRLLLLLLTLAAFSTAAHAAQPPKDKDKTPPVITDILVDPITMDSAVVSWTTDEPADSALRYGIAPKTNEKGPSDDTLILSHAIALSGLTAATQYAFCVESRDADNNKAEFCDTFMTLSEGSAPEQPATGGGASTAEKRIGISGFAYPGALVQITLKALPIGDALEYQTMADAAGAFSVEITDPPHGFHSFLISATDDRDTVSVRKGIQFEWRRGDAPIFKDLIVLPPTVTLKREQIGLGDDIMVSGSATPRTGIVVSVGGVFYETKSNDHGHYELAINSARLLPGQEELRVRTSLISELGYDYSFTKIVTISGTSVPEADLNRDGTVDLGDFSMFLASPRDMNRDNTVNAADLSMFLRAFKLLP